MKGRLVRTIVFQPDSDGTLIMHPDEDETLEYFDPDFFGDGIGWILRIKDGVDTHRYNTRYVEQIEWEAQV